MAKVSGVLAGRGEECRWPGSEPPALRHAEAARKRRLLRHLRWRWTDRPKCCNRCRSRRAPPATKPGWDARRSRCAARIRACRARSAKRDSARRSAARWRLRHHGRDAAKPGATSRFTRRPYFSVMGEPYSQRMPGVQREAGAEPPVVGEIGVLHGRAEIFVGVAEGEGHRVGHAEQEIGEVRARWPRR